MTKRETRIRQDQLMRDKSDSAGLGLMSQLQELAFNETAGPARAQEAEQDNLLKVAQSLSYSADPEQSALGSQILSKIAERYGFTPQAAPMSEQDMKTKEMLNQYLQKKGQQ